MGLDLHLDPCPSSAGRRTRLSPEARRRHLLDVAARMILADGLSAFTLEGLGRRAGVSKGLVYVYFQSRDALLAALFQREDEELRERGAAGAARAASFAETIRATTRAYLEQSRDRGALITALMSDPAVARRITEETRDVVERTRRYFAKLVAREYGLSPTDALAAVRLLMPVTGEAGRMISAGELTVEAAEALCMRTILGALDGLAQRPKKA